MLGNQYLTEAAPWTAFKSDPEQAGMIVRQGLSLVALFARVSHPFIPFASEAIAASVGEAYPQAWPERMALLPAGRKVAAGEVLFRKIEDAQVAEWIERFGGAEAA